jgi:hypothetical protein
MGLMSLLEEISREQSIQAVAWLLLAAFSQIYSRTREKKQNGKI